MIMGLCPRLPEATFEISTFEITFFNVAITSLVICRQALLQHYPIFSYFIGHCFLETMVPTTNFPMFIDWCICVYKRNDE